MEEKLEAVQRMQDYIEAHLSERIALTDLARVAFFSPWYCARIFRELTNLTPADYIRRRKLCKAALRLRDEDCRVTDLAFDLGFGSVDGYQRAFYREFGVNPHEYALHPAPLPLFFPYGVKFRELWKESKKMKEVHSVFIQIIEKPARGVIVKRGERAAEYWAYCQEVGCDVWGVLSSMKSLCGEPVCLWLPQEYRLPGTSEYVQGVEVEAAYDGPVPEGVGLIELPRAKYLMFQGEPFAEEDYCEAIEAVQTAMNRYDPSLIGYAWDDANPRIQLEPVGTRGYIELRAIKSDSENA